MDPRKTGDATPAPELASTYEAPRVETVLTGDDLEREGLYAGTTPQ